jgi:hypothetical protein
VSQFQIAQRYGITDNAAMTKKIKLRRITAHESMDCVQALADVLVDCVEGGASVSFMLPFPREKAVRFWQSVIEDVARN